MPLAARCARGGRERGRGRKKKPATHHMTPPGSRRAARPASPRHGPPSPFAQSCRPAAAPRRRRRPCGQLPPPHWGREECRSSRREGPESTSEGSQPTRATQGPHCAPARPYWPLTALPLATTSFRARMHIQGPSPARLSRPDPAKSTTLGPRRAPPPPRPPRCPLPRLPEARPEHSHPRLPLPSHGPGSRRRSFNAYT